MIVARQFIARDISKKATRPVGHGTRYCHPGRTMLRRRLQKAQERVAQKAMITTQGNEHTVSYATAPFIGPIPGNKLPG